MATVKISTENNQIVFTDSTGATYPYSQSSVDGRYNDTEVWFEHLYGEPNSFPFLTDNGYKPEHFLFADVLDANGVSLATRAAVQTYLSDKMGSVTALETATTGIVSDGNSTTTLLTSGSTFTGEWEDVSLYQSVIVAVKTDQEATYTIQFSPDGVNQDSTLTRYYRTNQIEPPHRFTVTRKYARIVFTNTSASDQTFIRLQTIYGAQTDLNAPMDSTLAQDFDAVVVRPTEYHTEVALGRRQGATLWNKFGYNDDIDVGTEVIASWGGTFTPLTTATTLIIASGSANDTDGGTGCNSIFISGIDENRDEQFELVTLNGTTSVVTATTWLGINRVAMYLCGTGQVNAGEINVIATTGGSTMAQMPIGGGVTEQCIFHIPRNYQFTTQWLFINVLNRGKNAELTVKMWVYSAISNGKQEVFRVDIDTQTTTTPVNLNPNLPFPISGSTVVWLEATSDKADVIVNARFSGELVRDINA